MTMTGKASAALLLGLTLATGSGAQETELDEAVLIVLNAV